MYRVLGPLLRPLRHSKRAPTYPDYESRFAALEDGQRHISLALEQLLLTLLSDRQIPRAIEELRASLASELATQAADISAANAAHWSGVEHQIMKLIGSPTPPHVTKNQENGSNHTPDEVV